MIFIVGGISYSQCFYKGLAYNVGTVITFDNGIKNKCKCIIDVPPPQTCSSAWVQVNVINTPEYFPHQATSLIPNPAPQPPSQKTVNTAPQSSTEIKDFYFYGLKSQEYKNDISITENHDAFYYEIKFKGTLLLNVSSRSDLQKIDYNNFEPQIYGTYVAVCYDVEKYKHEFRGKSGFAVSTKLDTNLSENDLFFKKKWLDQKITLYYNAVYKGVIVSSNNLKVGFNFNSTSNTLIQEKDDGWVKKSDIDLNKLIIKMYFDSELKKENALEFRLTISEKDLFIINQDRILIPTKPISARRRF